MRVYPDHGDVNDAGGGGGNNKEEREVRVRSEMMNLITVGTVLTDGKKEYTIEEQIGSGGFADVFKASQDGNYYAVKVIKTNDAKCVKSIKNEFEIANKVVSEHAIYYYFINEPGQNDFPCFIIMEFADGGSLYDELTKRVSQGREYKTEDLLNIYNQLVDGMIDISRIAVHRDLKPQNILISKGIYKISDYGLAKYSGEGTRATSQTMKQMGTELYYAPELCAQPSMHGINDIQVDIYAMGIVFYQLANLDYPYVNTADFRAMHMYESIKPFSKNVDIAIQSLIKKMLEKSKAKRFGTWTEIKEFLKNFSVVCSRKRDPFVANLLKNTESKKQAMDAKTNLESKLNSEKEAAFRRLISQIENEIYYPLKEIVDAYNMVSTSHSLHLSQIDINPDDETFSFEYTTDAISSDEVERNISFYFEVKHTETDIISRDLNDVGLFFNTITRQESMIFDYEYMGQRILLWGIVEADCGTGINIAILENPKDYLYGEVKMFIRTPNFNGKELLLPIDRSRLKYLCKNRFYEIQYSTKVEDFNFDVIKGLIQQNQTFERNSIHDPFERHYRI